MPRDYTCRQLGIWLLAEALFALWLKWLFGPSGTEDIHIKHLTFLTQICSLKGKLSWIHMLQNAECSYSNRTQLPNWAEVQLSISVSCFEVRLSGEQFTETGFKAAVRNHQSSMNKVSQEQLLFVLSGEAASRQKNIKKHHFERTLSYFHASSNFSERLSLFIVCLRSNFRLCSLKFQLLSKTALLLVYIYIP